MKTTRTRSNSFGGVSTASEFNVDDDCSDSGTDAPSSVVNEAGYCASAGSFCTDSEQEIADARTTEQNAAVPMHTDLPPSMPNLPPHMSHFVSLLLNQVSLEDLPKQLESKAAELSAAANYFDAMAKNAKVRGCATKPSYTKGQSWAKISEELEGADTPEGSLMGNAMHTLPYECLLSYGRSEANPSNATIRKPSATGSVSSAIDPSTKADKKALSGAQRRKLKKYGTLNY